MELPRIVFDPCRYQTVRTDAYGKFSLERGLHRYSTTPTDSVSNRGPSTNTGPQGGENVGGRCLSPLRHMVISISRPSEVMNKRILEKLVRPPRDTTASGT
jgi:hypothetical protein